MPSWSASIDESHDEILTDLINNYELNKSSAGRQILEVLAEVDMREYPNDVENPIEALRWELENSGRQDVDAATYDPDTFDGVLSSDEARDIIAHDPEPTINPKHVESTTMPKVVAERRQIIAAIVRFQNDRVYRHEVERAIQMHANNPQRALEEHELDEQLLRRDFWSLIDAGKPVYATRFRDAAENDAIPAMRNVREYIEMTDPVEAYAGSGDMSWMGDAVQQFDRMIQRMDNERVDPVIEECVREEYEDLRPTLSEWMGLYDKVDGLDDANNPDRSDLKSDLQKVETLADCAENEAQEEAIADTVNTYKKARAHLLLDATTKRMIDDLLDAFSEVCDRVGVKQDDYLVTTANSDAVPTDD